MPALAVKVTPRQKTRTFSLASIGTAEEWEPHCWLENLRHLITDPPTVSTKSTLLPEFLVCMWISPGSTPVPIRSRTLPFRSIVALRATSYQADSLLLSGMLPPAQLLASNQSYVPPSTVPIHLIVVAAWAGPPSTMAAKTATAAKILPFLITLLLYL